MGNAAFTYPRHRLRRTILKWLTAGAFHALARLEIRSDVDRKGAAIAAERLRSTWSAKVPYGGTSLIVAGNTIVSAGPGSKGHGVSLMKTWCKIKAV